MTFEQSADFDIEALYAALDAKRQARAMSWAQVMREINGQFEHLRARPISASTVTGLRSRSVVEGDGVLQMLRWLDRTPESFVPAPNVAQAGLPLPQVDSHRILRFDSRAIFVALDAQRVERSMTWTAIAREIGGVSAAVLTGLAKGGRVSFPSVMRIIGWLGQPAANFTRVSDW